MSELRVLGRLMMPSLVSAGLGSNAIIREVQRVLGGGWRRKVMLDDIREITGMMRMQSQFELLRPLTRIPKNMMTDVPLKQSLKYMAKGVATKMDSLTGQVFEQYVSIYTNELESKEDLDQLYSSTTAVRDEYWNEVVESIQWIGVLHNEGWPY